jgi:hypothetical protein
MWYRLPERFILSPGFTLSFDAARVPTCYSATSFTPSYLLPEVMLPESLWS